MAFSASLFKTTIAIRLLMGARGRVLSNSTELAKPTTRVIFDDFVPHFSSSQRTALARSADNSQFV